MAERLDDLQSAVLELGRELRRLEARVCRLEWASGPAGAPASAVPGRAAPPEPAARVALPPGTVALAGWTLLVMAGAYLARALTDARAVPTVVGVGLGLGYAALWLLRADREAARERRESAAFHAVAAGLIAFPLLWEATTRFGLLGARTAAAAVAGACALGLGVAWRRGLAVVACAWTALALATAVALLAATRGTEPRATRRSRPSCAPRRWPRWPSGWPRRRGADPGPSSRGSSTPWSSSAA